MANDYYNYTGDFVPGTTVRADGHDTEYAAIAAGFDKLAGETELNTGSIVYGADTGSADAYITDNGGTTTFIVGQQVSFTPLANNTGASTLTLNSGVAKAVVRNSGSVLSANDLLAGVPVLVIYDGTSWVLVGATAEQAAETTRTGINAQTGTTYTVTLTDENKVILCSNAAAIAVTIPNDTNDSLPVGFIAHINQAGAGQVTIGPDAGVTLNNALTLKTRQQYSSLSVVKTAANTYLVIGDMSAT